MGKQDRHLSAEDRAVILIGSSKGESVRSSARTLGRSASTDVLEQRSSSHATLRRMHPDDVARWISHETIDAAIHAHPRGALKQGMLAALRQGNDSRGRRRTTLAKSQT